MTARPNATEFKLFLEYFLTAKPNTTCYSGAVFGDAFILGKDNETVLSESCDCHVIVVLIMHVCRVIRMVGHVTIISLD